MIKFIEFSVVFLLQSVKHVSFDGQKILLAPLFLNPARIPHKFWTVPYQKGDGMLDPIIKIFHFFKKEVFLKVFDFDYYSGPYL